MARTSWSSTPFDRLRISIFGEYSSRHSGCFQRPKGWARLGLGLSFAVRSVRLLWVVRDRGGSSLEASQWRDEFTLL